jgi:hypothetical protein
MKIQIQRFHGYNKCTDAWIQMHKKKFGYKMESMCCGNKCKAAQKQMLKKKIHGYRCNLFPDTNVNEKLWIHKCKHAWKQIQKCMKTKCMDEFMDTNSKIFGYKWEKCKDAWITKCKGFHGYKNAKIHGYKNTQDFWIQMQRHMDAKCKYSWIQKCQDAWIQMQGFKDTKMQRC